MATAKRPARKRAPTKRAPRTATPSKAESNGECPVCHGSGHLAERDESADFAMLPDGRVHWRMAGQLYMLRPLPAAAFVELDWLRRGGSTEVMTRLADAALLPGGTPEERAAKFAALREANEYNAEWVYGWFDKLFEYGEQSGQAFPRAAAPAWIFRPELMPKLVEHLEGPLPPGVV